MISQNKQQKQIEMAWRNVRDVETAQSDPPSLKLDKVPQITTCQVTLKYPYKHLIYCTVKIRKNFVNTFQHGRLSSIGYLRGGGAGREETAMADSSPSVSMSKLGKLCGWCSAAESELTVG